LCIENPQAITMEEALQYTVDASLLISATDPYIIQLVNQAFESTYSLSNQSIRGHTIMSIVASSDLSFPFRGLIEEAARGKMAEGTVHVHPNSQDVIASAVTCIPVTELLGEEVNSVLMLFSPLPQEHGSHQSQPLPRNDPDVWRGGKAEAPSFGCGLGPVNPFPHRLAEHHPQFRPCPAAPSSKQGGITRETLNDLYHLSLVDAASALGVSPSTLKLACRRLGVARWPRPATPAPFAPTTTSVISGNGSGSGGGGSGEMSLAYSRRLHRKYADEDARRGRRSAAEAAAMVDAAASASTAPAAAAVAQSCDGTEKVVCAADDDGAEEARGWLALT
jgi:hypothetical protein